MFSYAAATDAWLRRVDRRRNAVLALLLVELGIERAIGIHTPPVAVGILGTWLLAGIAIGRVMPRIEDPRRIVQLRIVLVVASTIAIAFVQHLMGATVWAGGAAYFYILAITAIGLPARVLAAVTALCTMAYGTALFGEALGWLAAPRLSGGPSPVPTIAQAITAWLFMALTLGSVSILLHGFVRIVRQSAEWHQLLVEQAPVMIGTLDRSGQITAANPAAAAAFGVTSGALVGRAFRTLFPDHADESSTSPLSMVLAGSAQQFETRMRRADGAERWVDVVTHPLVRGGRRDVQYVLCLLRDRKSVV